jgi:hypothetical protein
MHGILFEPDGWVSLLPGPDGAEGIHVRVRDYDGRLVITDMYIHAPEITPEILRGISVSRVQATINALQPRPGDFFAEVLRAVVYAHHLHLPDDNVPEPSLAELRQRTPSAGTDERPDRPRLTRPDGVPPEEFYPRVAAAYTEYAPQTRAPAKEIATEAEVPVTTAHRWIREARRRGFLPPAMKGKAG